MGSPPRRDSGVDQAVSVDCQIASQGSPTKATPHEPTEGWEKPTPLVPTMEFQRVTQQP